MNDTEFDEWVLSQNNSVIAYLENQGISSPNVASWPAFEVAPYFAIWAIESKKISGKIGWWAFSGDCPFDYVSEDGNCHPRSALSILINNWNSYIPFIKKGEQPPNTNFEDKSKISTLANLLEARVELLKEWHDNDELWDDH